MTEGEGARGDGIDAALAARAGDGGSPVLGALLFAAGWLAAAAGIGWALGLLPAGWAPEAAWARGAAGLALAAPVAGALGWAALAARIGAAERRLAAQARAASRAVPAAAPGAAGLSRSDLTHAVAHAARDALDRERGAIARQLAELGEAQRRLDAAVAALTEARGAARAPEAETEGESGEAPAAAPALPEAEPRGGGRGAIPASPPREAEGEDAQAALPLSAEAMPPEEAFDWDVAAKALDFPRDASDDAGFAALAVATRDRPTAELLQAAEDALTLLAQHGLYMEDLEVRHAPASAWRRFAEGARGPEVRAVGGVESAEAVSETRALLKADPVFRDTAMHLMRRYDGLLRRAAASSRGESAMLAMADSRTGRAFMLAAQAVGAFD